MKLLQVIFRRSVKDIQTNQFNKRTPMVTANLSEKKKVGSCTSKWS